jgi:hypothetical protein
LSLEDQIDHAKQIASVIYSGPVEYREIATKGKGERLDRPELAEVEAMLRTGELDLLIVEDIGRIVRGVTAVTLCGIAVDHGTRVLAPNDCIDTAEETWEEDVISACRDHVNHNSHTSKRLKHKLMNRFLKFGGATARPIYGYVIPPTAKTYDDWQIDPAATPVYCEWFRILRETGNCSAVADYLNVQGISTGPYSRRKTWDGKMVRRLTRNPLLKGMASRGAKFTRKHHETGRRISVKNPDGPQFREVLHLAHVSTDEWDEVNLLLDARNAGHGRKAVNGQDPLLGVPRKRTRFPGQHALCAYCGRQYVWGGNGMTANLMCAGARAWACWNSIGFNGILAAEKLVQALASELYRLEGFDSQFHDLVQKAIEDGFPDVRRRWERLRRDEQEIVRQKEHLLAAIADYGPKPMIQEKLAEIEATEHHLGRERRELEALQTGAIHLPDSVSSLRDMIEAKFKELTISSPEFGGLMRLVAPDFRTYLVRPCDGGHPVPRARVRLSLAGIMPVTRHVASLEDLCTRVVTLDLFEPPQRVRLREEVARLHSQGLNQRDIARRLSERASQAVVQRTLALDWRMRAQGLQDPYVTVTEPPADYTKLRRHRNPRYRFEPTQGFSRLQDCM